MGKKNKKKYLEQLEQVGQPAPEQAQPEAPQSSQPKVEFDVWWALRGKKMPQQHLKEIVKADFKGRGLSLSETLAAYDKALEAYGVKLR